MFNNFARYDRDLFLSIRVAQIVDPRIRERNWTAFRDDAKKKEGGTIDAVEKKIAANERCPPSICKLVC